VFHAIADTPSTGAPSLTVITMLGVPITAFVTLSDTVSSIDQFPIERSDPVNLGPFRVTILPLILSRAVQLYSYDPLGAVAHMREKVSDILKVVLVTGLSSDHTIRIVLHIVSVLSFTRILRVDSTVLPEVSVIVTLTVYIPGSVYAYDWNIDVLDHGDGLSFLPSQKSHI
jgi:hypothetical protein